MQLFFDVKIMFSMYSQDCEYTYLYVMEDKW